MRWAARRFGVHLRTVQRWVDRARQIRRLDRVDFASHAPGCRRAARRTALELEDRVLTLRRQLREEDPLGEYGAAAIHRALLLEASERAWALDVPCVRTINRILLRRGALDGNRRRRFDPPPRGWHLPAVGAAQAELDSFDIVEGLAIKGRGEIAVLNGISLHGGLCASWPMPSITSKITVEKLLEHWRQFGLPGYVQFDNDAIFQGAHQWPDTFGRVTRLCLGLGVVPVFAPPRETGFQAAIENYNGRWQSKVWHRFTHENLTQLTRRSDAFVAAARARAAARIDSAPPRRNLARRMPEIDDLLRRPLRGTVIFLRRTDDRGAAHLLGQRFEINANWPHRLTRAEVDLSAGRVRFFALRRRDPHHQPLLKEISHVTPTAPFRG